MPKRSTPTFWPSLKADGLGVSKTFDGVLHTMGTEPKRGWGSWLILAILLGLLCIAIVVLYVSWDPEQSGAMTGAGYVAMTLGIVATLALGIGLMALMYYSNRSGRD
jgi:hypothetical protein